MSTGAGIEAVLPDIRTNKRSVFHLLRTPPYHFLAAVTQCGKCILVGLV